MKSKTPKSWSRKRYPMHEQRRVERLFSQGSEASDEEREAYIREQTEDVQRAWRAYEASHRTVQQSPEVEVPRWKKS